MTTYQRESVSEVLEDIKPLLERHWEEIATYKDIPLDPNYDMYRFMDSCDRVRVFTARLDSQLVGYGVFFIGNLHYQSSLIATQDILFVLPEYRKGGIGYRLIRYCDRELQAEGAQVIYQHVKQAHDFGPLLMRVGYEPVETIYAKKV